MSTDPGPDLSNSSMFEDTTEVFRSFSIIIVSFEVVIKFISDISEGSFFWCSNELCNVRIFSSGVMINLRVEHAQDVRYHTMLIDFDASSQITAINAGEPYFNLTFLIYGDLFFINTKVSYYFTEFHISADTSPVEMEYVGVGDMVDLC